ncbi:MAG: aminopeptidase [Anaerolineae bacterium]|jgi:endoglucanase|nr:MAG: aminopeptidase [Anaerolineae bacterium]
MKTNHLSNLLKKLTTPPGLSGYEEAIAHEVETLWKPFVDELARNRLGSVLGFLEGSGEPPRPRLMLVAHQDAIGLMVSGIKEGFLRLTEIGGVDHRILPGQLVQVHGKRTLPAVIVQPPSFLLPPEAQDGSVPLTYLWADTGLDEKDVQRWVQIGDLVSFNRNYLELNSDLVCSPSLDNRASLCALTLCLEELKNRSHTWDIWAVSSTQEEETLGGAATSAFQIRPDLAVVIDVTHASGPGSPAHKTYPLGKGITLGWGPTVHPKLYEIFKDLAEKLEIPCKMEAMPRYSGTDADRLQTVAEGIPTMVVSIPLRYMHTPVEMVSKKDIRRAARLLAEFASSLDLDFMEKIQWDETPKT